MAVRKEILLKYLFLLSALVAGFGVVLIFIFVGAKGFSIFGRVGLFKFLFSLNWHPTQGEFGILPMILGSFAVTLGALVLGGPLAIATAIFLSEIAPPRINRLVRPAVELLAGIPSVVYGFFGIVVLRQIIGAIFHDSGLGLLTGCIVLAIMILPTIAAISEDAISAVPRVYRSSSLALGATRWQTIWKVVLPAARPGITNAVILGLGRAIGETMAVLMVIGNAPVVPQSISGPVSTLTSQIVLDMSYAAGDHQIALFAMGIVLLLISMSLIVIIRLVPSRRMGR